MPLDRNWFVEKWYAREMEPETAILEHLLTSDAAISPIASLHEFSTKMVPSFTATVDRAIAGGFAADRLGYAFAAGYRAALARLVPDVATHACLCATEAGGGHPRFIKTTLAAHGEAFRLNGTKTWVTLGEDAVELLVVASVGEEAGRNRLKVARVPAKREGVTLVQKEAAPFAPEIPHSEAQLTDVHVASHEVLAGDGYDAVLKPFRTIEDIHVSAAALAYVARVARHRAWPHAIVEEAFAALLALRALGAADASSRATHIALGGALGAARRVYDACDATFGDEDDEAARWRRDRVLLDVASKARTQRLATAWAGASALTSS